MTCTTFLHESELNQRLPDQEAQYILEEARKHWADALRQRIERLEAANAELVEAIKAEMDPSWECSSYHPKLHVAIKKHGGAA